MATNAYRLDDLELVPATLDDSLARFEQDEGLVSAFHPEFVRAFLVLKRHEIEKARAAVPGYGTDAWHGEITDWERDQFLFLS
jgi:glutamine synthetase